MPVKVYVDVLVHHDCDGRELPLEVIWPDGRQFEVDRVLNVEAQVADYVVGGAGVCYTCRIVGKITRLYDEDGKWFMVGK